MLRMFLLDRKSLLFLLEARSWAYVGILTTFIKAAVVYKRHRLVTASSRSSKQVFLTRQRQCGRFYTNFRDIL